MCSTSEAENSIKMVHQKIKDIRSLVEAFKRKINEVCNYLVQRRNAERQSHLRVPALEGEDGSTRR